MVSILFIDLLKKILGLLLVLVVPFCFYACSSGVDHAWLFKCDKGTIPEGVYRYYLRESYNKAVDIVSESGSSLEKLSDQKIGGKSFGEWIKNDAMTSCKDLLAIEVMFQDEKLFLTDEENSKVSSSTESAFSALEQEFKELSVSKEDFKRAYAECKIKYQKLFDYFYEKGGKEEVTDKDLIEYYKNEYVNYSMLTKYVFLSNKLDGEQQFKESNVSEEQVRSAQSQIEEYVDLLNSGKKGIKEIANIFKEKEKLSTDPLETETICLKDADVSDEILNKLKELNVGKADYVRINDTFVLLFKNNISNNLPNISNKETRLDILKSFKVDDLYRKFELVKNGLHIELNSKLVKEIVPENLFKFS